MFYYNNPWREMEDFRREMDSLFERVRGSQRVSFPLVNLYDVKENVVAEFVMPGVKREDIDIQFENDILVVKGKRDNDVDEKYSIVRSERFGGEFKRSVEIPVKVDVNKIEATFKNGILTITLPKAEEAKPKQITIK